MRQVKIFTDREDRTDNLERKINQWICESEAKIVSITGNIAPQSPMSYPGKQPGPSDVLLVVVYETADVPVMN